MAEGPSPIFSSLWALSIRQTDSYPFSPFCRMLATRVMPTRRNGKSLWSLTQPAQCHEPTVILFIYFPARIAEKVDPDPRYPSDLCTGPVKLAQGLDRLKIKAVEPQRGLKGASRRSRVP